MRGRVALGWMVAIGLGLQGCNKNVQGPSTDTNQNQQQNQNQQPSSGTPGGIVGSAQLSNTSNYSGITVTLLLGTSVVATATTEASGGFTFSNLTPTLYSVAAYKAGYSTGDAPQVNLQPGETRTLSVISMGAEFPMNLDVYAPGLGTFTALHQPIGDIASVVPPGLTSDSSGHIFPSDHGYFNYPSPAPASRPAYAPGTGIVIEVKPELYGLTVQMTQTFAYGLGHVVVDPSITVGMTLVAGQQVGTEYGGSGVDLGVLRTDLTQPYVTPSKYSYRSLHADTVVKYFQEPLKSQLYAKMEVVGSNKDGGHCHDLPGKLMGNWFHESAPSAWVGGETKGLSFHPFVLDPSIKMVTTGSSLTMAGRYTFDAGPDPATVSTASGKVAYQLRRQVGSPETGLMMVEMLEDNKVKIETFLGSTLTTADFTVNAKIFVR